MRHRLARLLALATIIGAPIASAQDVHPAMAVRLRAPTVVFDRFEGALLGLFVPVDLWKNAEAQLLVRSARGPAGSLGVGLALGYSR